MNLIYVYQQLVITYITFCTNSRLVERNSGLIITSYLATAVKASSTLTPVLALVSMKGTEYSWRHEEEQITVSSRVNPVTSA